MSRAVDEMLLREMAREDHVEVMTEDFDVLDMMYDEETGQAFTNIFTAGDEDATIDDDNLNY